MTKSTFRAVPTRRGFTLIELLIVVAIIAILAAIAVPNFLEAQTRAKVARVRADMRSLATAVEAYRVDFNSYIPRSKAPQPTGGAMGFPDVLLRQQELGRLTTPVAFITSLPSDVFEQRFPSNNLIEFHTPVLIQHYRVNRFAVPNPFNSWNYNQQRQTRENFEFGWGMSSVGPSRRFGAAAANQGNLGETGNFSFFREYDPTNGTISEGNVWRFSRDSPADVVFRSLL